MNLVSLTRTASLTVRQADSRVLVLSKEYLLDGREVDYCNLSSDGSKLILARFERPIRIVDICSGCILGELACLNSRNDNLYKKSPFLQLSHDLWTVTDLRTAVESATVPESDHTIKAYFSRDDSKLFLVLDGAKELRGHRVWDIAAGEYILAISINFVVSSALSLASGILPLRPQKVLVANCLSGSKYKIRSLDFSPDERRLVGSAYTNKAYIWDVLTGEFASLRIFHVCALCFFQQRRPLCCQHFCQGRHLAVGN